MVRRGWAKPAGEPPATVEDALDRLQLSYEYAQGDEVKVLCFFPGHDDHEPSLSINTAKKVFYCFPCDKGGSLAELVAARLGSPVTVTSAARWLRRIECGTVPAPPEPYGQVFTQPPERVYYESSLARFYDPPKSVLDDRVIAAEAARAYGIRWYPLQRRNGDIDPAWILPARDPGTGELRGWQVKTDSGTWCTPGMPKGRTLFGIERFRVGSTAILVESPLDCAVLLTVEIDGGLASFGAKVSEHQIRLLTQVAGQIVLALDNDRTGRKATERLLERLTGCGRPVYTFDYGDMKGKDVGDLDDEEIEWGIENAVLRMS